MIFAFHPQGEIVAVFSEFRELSSSGTDLTQSTTPGSTDMDWP